MRQHLFYSDDLSKSPPRVRRLKKEAPRKSNMVGSVKGAHNVEEHEFMPEIYRYHEDHLEERSVTALPTLKPEIPTNFALVVLSCRPDQLDCNRC